MPTADDAVFACAQSAARIAIERPAVNGIRTVLIVTGLAILGAIIGAGLGYLAGMAYVILADVSPIEGQSGITVFYEFVPLGTLLGMMSMPIIIVIWRRSRKRLKLGSNAGLR